MNSLDACYRLLKDLGRPLHYREITREILERGLWSTKGKTPEETIKARLSTEIKYKKNRSRFTRVGPGVYTISENSEAPARAEEVHDTVSFADAAEQILLRSKDQAPMHYREITSQALAERLIVTRGKTPEATMYAQIHSEIKRSTKRGDLPRFVNLGSGMFSLTRWQKDGLAFQIERHNRRIRLELLDRLRRMDPTEFEELVGKALTAIGFESVEITSASNDSGIDVRGSLVVGAVIQTMMAVQVKRWQKNVHAPIVQQVRGSLGTHEQGLIITTGDFSSGARTEAERPDAIPVALMNGEQFVRVLIEHDIGVHRSSHDIIELGENGTDTTL